MANFLKRTRTIFSRKTLPPLRFPTTGFEIVPASQSLEEEHYDEFERGSYCPVNIGDVYASNTFQILGKLGFGSTSTVWLARNLQYGYPRFMSHGRSNRDGSNRDYSAVKVFIRNDENLCRKEFEIYQSIANANRWHPGHSHVRTAEGMFSIARDGGDHQCLVQPPMWDSWGDLLYRNPSRRFSVPLLKGGLRHLLLALDYLHTECRLVHTGIAPAPSQRFI